MSVRSIIVFCVMACLGVSLAGAGMAQQVKAPSRYDPSREFYVDTGFQNMPYRLFGDSMKWDSACRKGNSKECAKLAKAFEEGLGPLRADGRVALGYHRLGCAAGDGLACARSATIALFGQANHTSREKAIDWAGQGCALKSQTACAIKAEALLYGTPSAADRSQAMTLLDAACAANDSDGCRVKAWTLYGPEGKGRDAALPLFEAGCARKWAWACEGVADAYDHPSGVGVDRAKAMEAARIGCTEGIGTQVRVCRQHGVYLTWSKDVAELNKGEDYLNTSCIAGDGRACFEIGKVGLRRKAGARTTYGEGLYYSRHACDLGYPGGCEELARAYEGGQVVEKNPITVIALLDRACRLGGSYACQKAQTWVTSYPDWKQKLPTIDPSAPVKEQLAAAKSVVEGAQTPEQADSALNNVIQLMYEQHEDAQWLFGGWLYYGVPGVIATDRKDDALILFDNAARVGHVEAAIWLGMAYWYGEGVPLDRPKGERYMAIGAARGSEYAESLLISMQGEEWRQENQRRFEQIQAYKAAQYERWKNWEAMGMSRYGFSSASNTSSYSPPAYTGRSVSSIMDEHNWNNRYNYLSGKTSVCASSNPYCR